MSDALLLVSTSPDVETAAKIARTLVEEHLAACVNRVSGLTSVFCWRGEIHEDSEVLLLIKSTRDRFEALSARLIELHPYELPELIALNIVAGHTPYLDWLREQTRL
jgi:periplasmic divalent cation tolerance protein